MSTARNDLCDCRKRGAWRTRDAAWAALDRILRGPIDTTRLYNPTGVERCREGIWHLTSRPRKIWKKGKTPRHHGR